MMKRKLGVVRLAVVVMLTLGLVLIGPVGVALADSPPTIAWLDQFGTSADDYAYGVAVDGEGNAYVVGNTLGTLPGQTSSGGRDAFVRKYDSSGNELWTRQFGSNTNDIAYDVAVDGEGNAYVVGYTFGTLPEQTSSGSFDAFVRKYDSSGNESWTRQFGTDAIDVARGVAVDGAGNAYVVGDTTGALPGQASSGRRDAFVRKYDSSGAELWTRQFSSSAYDFAYGVAADGAGNAYVVGDTDGILPGQTTSGVIDAFVRKYDSSGNESWTRQFGSNNYDYARGVAVDGAGNAYVAGITRGTIPGQTSPGGRDAFVRKYDSSGNESWTRQFGTSADDYAYGVVVDGDGNPYVVGDTTGTLTGQASSGVRDGFVRKYNSSGNESWTRQFGSSANDTAWGVAVDEADNAYVAGFTDGTLPGQTSSGGVDVFIVKFAGVTNGNTPAGTDVKVAVGSHTITFGEVTTSGNTTVTTSDAGHTIPTLFKLGTPPTYFDFTTTAVYEQPVTICIDYSEISFDQEDNLSFKRWDGIGWVDVTTSVDTENDIICGETSSLSVFVVVEPVINQPPVADDKAVSTDEDTPKEITLSGSDVETIDLTFAIVSVPSHGTLSSITDIDGTSGTPNTDTANVTYTPHTDYYGADNFTYKVTDDGEGESPPLHSDVATVSITVSPENSPPVADIAEIDDDTIPLPVTIKVTPQTLNLERLGRWVKVHVWDDSENTPQQMEVILDGSNSSDPDGDSLTYDWTLTGPEGDITVTDNVTSQVMILSAGQYTVTLVVNDGTVDSAPASENFTLTDVTIDDLASVDPAEFTLNGVPASEVKGGDTSLVISFDDDAIAATVEVGLDVEMRLEGPVSGVDYIDVIQDKAGGNGKGKSDLKNEDSASSQNK